MTYALHRLMMWQQSRLPDVEEGCIALRVLSQIVQTTRREESLC